MFDLFNDLFGLGSGTKIEQLATPLASLEARVRDIERSIKNGAGGPPAPNARLFSHANKQATEKEIGAFLIAWRKDLEIAHMGKLLDEEEKGTRSFSLAKRGFDLAEEGSWDHARVYFAAAHRVASAHWSRCQTAVDNVLARMKEEPVFLLEHEELEALFDRFEIDYSAGGEALRKRTQAKTALEWLEAMYAFCEDTLVFKGFIPGWFMEKARAGEWEELLEKSGVKESLVDVLSLDHARNKFSDHVRESGDTHWAGNYLRIMRCCLWGTGHVAKDWSVSHEGETSESAKWVVKRKRMWDREEPMTDDDGNPLYFDTKDEAIAAFWHRHIFESYL